MNKMLAMSGVAIILAAGSGYFAPASAQNDPTAIRKSCVAQVRKSLGLQKGQPMGRGHGRSIDACIANGGKL